MQLELGLHDAPELHAPGQLGRLGSTHTTQRRFVGATGPIAASAAIAAHLARDPRGGPAQPAGDRPQRLTASQPPRDLLALSERQPQRRPLRLRRRWTLQVVDVPARRPPIPPDLLTDPPERHPTGDQLSQPLLLLARQPLHASPSRSDRARSKPVLR